jgi:hypothetical protein
MAVQSTANNSLHHRLDQDDRGELEKIRQTALHVLSGWDIFDRQGFHPNVEKRLLDALTWSLTEGSDSKSQKYKTRYRSKTSAEASRKRESIRIQHEHVVPRAWLRDQISGNRQKAAEIGELAVACVVTVEEHNLGLDKGKRQEGSFGWQRYVDAGIQVLDAFEDGFPEVKAVDLENLANQQRNAIENLGLSPLD